MMTVVVTTRSATARLINTHVGIDVSERTATTFATSRPSPITVTADTVHYLADTTHLRADLAA